MTQEKTEKKEGLTPIIITLCYMFGLNIFIAIAVDNLPVMAWSIVTMLICAALAILCTVDLLVFKKRVMLTKNDMLELGMFIGFYAFMFIVAQTTTGVLKDRLGIAGVVGMMILALAADHWTVHKWKWHRQVVFEYQRK